MFNGSFATQNSMMTFIFKFDPMKCQLQVTLGQLRSKFKIQNILTKICLPCAVLSQDSKKGHAFYLRPLQMQKNTFQKWSVITFTCFWPLHSQKQRCNCACALFILFSITYLRFFDNLKISDFIGNYFWKIEILDFGVKIEKYQKSDTAIL